MTKPTKEFAFFLDAVEDILAGKPVEDLDERIKNWSNTPLDSVKVLIDAKRFVPWSRYENRILQGEKPEDVYETPFYERWRKEVKRFLEGIVEKYKNGQNTIA